MIRASKAKFPSRNLCPELAKKRNFASLARHTPVRQPGMVVVDPLAQRPTITAMAYGQTNCERIEIKDLETLPALLQRHAVTWINVDGLGDAATIQRLGQMFHLHPLALEDAVNVHQRPKVDEYPGHLFIVARFIHLNDSWRASRSASFSARILS